MRPSFREVEQIVARGESEQAEFKRSTGQRTEAVRTVCALLNGSGGFVLFGVTDGGVLVGQDVSPGTLESIVREIRRTDPPALLSPETVDLPNGRAIILIRVPRGEGPYMYDGGAYVRLGPTTSFMPAAHYQKMLLDRVHSSRRWELTPTELGIGDLDHDEVIRTAEEAIWRNRMEDPGTRRVEELLLGFGVMRDGALLNAAVVLFARPGAVVSLYPQCTLRESAGIRGNALGDPPSDEEEDHGVHRQRVRAGLADVREPVQRAREAGARAGAVPCIGDGFAGSFGSH
jgi:ATP-dependent DNA helicase RecG